MAEHKNHNRDHECQKGISMRLATIEGHIKAVRKMLDEDKSCVDIIKQLMAIESSVKKVGIEMLNNHLNTCIIDSAGDEDKVMEQLKEFSTLLKMYI